MSTFLSNQGTRRTRVARRVVGSILLVVVIFSPWFGIPSWDSSVAVTALIFGIAATAVNLMLGYGGLLNLGAAFFMGTGGYGEALAYYHLHWPLVPAALLAIVLSMAVAGLLGLVLVRLPRFYFAVATLGLSVALDGVLAALPNTTGGSSGITHARQLSFGVLTVSSVDSWYVLMLILVALVVVAVRRATGGKTGRLLALAREDELAANVVGVEVFRVRLALFVLAAGILALAGTVIFPWQGVIVPADAGLVQSVLLLGSAVVGGMGYLVGGFVGAALLTWVQTLVSSFGNYESLIYGLAYLAVVFYLNPGVGGTLVWIWRRTWAYLDVRLPAGVGELASVGADGLGPTTTWRQGSVSVGMTGAGSAKARAKQLPVPAAPEKVPVPGGSPARIVGELRLDSAVRRFGGVTAVGGVSVSVAGGSVVGVIGANGAGKSTLLNLISGVEPLDSGTLIMNGRDMATDSVAKRAAMGLARTFQTPRLVEQMSVLENVMLGVEALSGNTFRRSVQDEDRARFSAAGALDRAGLGALAERDVRSLGSGERKFVELIRALASSPSVLLMDEPGTGLSNEELISLRGWLRELADSGTGVLLVDHNMDFIGNLVDWVYVMEMGVVTASGVPAEIEMVASRLSSEEADASGQVL